MMYPSKQVSFGGDSLDDDWDPDPHSENKRQQDCHDEESSTSTDDGSMVDMDLTNHQTTTNNSATTVVTTKKVPSPFKAFEKTFQTAMAASSKGRPQPYVSVSNMTTTTMVTAPSATDQLRDFCNQVLMQTSSPSSEGYGIVPDARYARDKLFGSSYVDAPGKRRCCGVIDREWFSQLFLRWGFLAMMLAFLTTTMVLWPIQDEQVVMEAFLLRGANGTNVTAALATPKTSQVLDVTPTSSPTKPPTVKRTKKPRASPTLPPTARPTVAPSAKPRGVPTTQPTVPTPVKKNSWYDTDVTEKTEATKPAPWYHIDVTEATEADKVEVTVEIEKTPRKKKKTQPAQTEAIETSPTTPPIKKKGGHDTVVTEATEPAKVELTKEIEKTARKKNKAHPAPTEAIETPPSLLPPPIKTKGRYDTAVTETTEADKDVKKKKENTIHEADTDKATQKDKHDKKNKHHQSNDENGDEEDQG